MSQCVGCFGCPNGCEFKSCEVEQVDPQLKDLTLRLKKLSPEERLEVFGSFCVHCGTDQLPCHCWNDE